MKKRILITGITGFVGSHLARAFRKRGIDVVGISRKSSGNTHIQRVNLTNQKALENVFQKTKFSACFHLAGESLVENGQKYPHQTLRENIQSALNVLELCRIHKVSRIIIASTAQVYGNTHGFCHEEMPARPSRPYETSKACIDLVAQSYADSFHLPVLIPRFVNIYGPGDLNFTRVIPKTIRSIIRKEQPILWGGDIRRNYLYIDDAIDAYMRLAGLPDLALEKNRVFNFGSDESVTVKELMETLIQLSGTKLTIRKVPVEREGEVVSQEVSSKKARRILKWKPKTTLRVGLQKTLVWYKRYFRTLEKIKVYRIK